MLLPQIIIFLIIPLQIAIFRPPSGPIAMRTVFYITQIFVSFSLVPVLNKLPDHHNLPLFDDMLQFWYQS